MTDSISKVYNTDCENCSLNGNAVIGLRGKKKDARVLFIGDSPRSSGMPDTDMYYGLTGRIFKGICNLYGFGLEEDCFTYMCACSSQNKAPSKNDIECCYPRLRQEIEEINPKFIVLLGTNVATKLVQGFTKITSNRGERIYLFDTYPAVVTFDPSILTIEDGYSLFRSILLDFEKAFNFVNGVFYEEELPTETSFMVVNEMNMQSVFDWLHDYTHIAYDWETTGLNPRKDKGFCLGLCGEQGKAYIIPQYMLNNETLLKELRGLFKREDIEFIAFNAVFDASFNTVYNVEPRIDHDPMLMHFLLDERKQRRNLENLSVDYCNAPRYESKMLAEYETTKATFLEDIPEYVIQKYCAMDADYTFRLFKRFYRDLSESGSTEKLKHFYTTIFIPACRMIREVQHHGLYVDYPKLMEMVEHYGTEVELGLISLKELAGDEDFNPNSPKQVSKKLWDEYSMQQPDIFGRKDRSVDKKTREALLKQYPSDAFVTALMEYKTNQVMFTRYIQPLMHFIEPDGRIRTNWHMDRTETGRLSTSSPPLHQIPRESAIRSLFCAPDGYILVQADYAQVEMRMAALIADDLDFADMFKSGVDFHTKMASEAYKIKPEDVTPAQRQAAKGVSFGLLYLMGVKSLADFTGLEEKEAYKFVGEYKKLMPDVMKWIEQTKKDIEQKHEVWSIFGRVRRFPLVLNTNRGLVHRQGVNMPVQSSASDLTLICALILHDTFKSLEMDAKIVITVHDSIVVECAEEIQDEVARMMYDTMTGYLSDSIVPFDTEIKIGKRWGAGKLWTKED